MDDTIIVKKYYAVPPFEKLEKGLVGKTPTRQLDSTIYALWFVRCSLRPHCVTNNSAKIANERRVSCIYTKETILIKYLKVTFVLVTVVVSSFFSWITGYLFDPEFLGPFTPFILILIFVSPLFFFFLMLAGLLRSENRNRKNYLACFIAAIAVMFLCSPLRPTSVDGFYYRMGKIDRDEYLAAAKLVKSEVDRLGIGTQDLGYPETQEHDNLVESIRDQNLLFSISKVPIHISNDEGYVVLSWGSGLTGAYEVLVTSGEEEPSWLKNRFHPPKRLYENVILLID